MTFAAIEYIVSGLDKERQISNDFGETIINKIENIALFVDLMSNDVVLQSIDLLYGFGKEDGMNFCVKKEKKQLLARVIFNISISCIENDYEEGIRKSSNALGWMTIDAIKQGMPEQVKYLLKLANKMLEISCEMNVSKKTKTFIVTLFTTVGMYCYKELSYTKYKAVVFDSIKDVADNIVYTAIEIRTYENDMWNSLFENNTQNYMKKFREDYRKSKQ